MWSEKGSSQHADIPNSEGTLTVLEASQAIRGPEEDRGRAEDDCFTDSSETWHHVEPVDEVISASDSEGREVYARGVSPDRPLSTEVLPPLPFMEKSSRSPIPKPAKDAEKLSTPAPTSDKGLKPRSGEKSKRAATREDKQDRQLKMPDGATAQSDQQPIASGQDITVNEVGLSDGSEVEVVGAQTPTVEGTDGKTSSSQDDVPNNSEGLQTASNGKEDGGSGHGSVRKPQKENAQGVAAFAGPPDQRSGAWGWTSWSKLTEQFREGVSGAARDVQELTTSFQQVTHAYCKLPFVMKAYQDLRKFPRSTLLHNT
jgi:hypothetical protein